MPEEHMPSEQLGNLIRALAALESAHMVSLDYSFETNASLVEKEHNLECQRIAEAQVFESLRQLGGSPSWATGLQRLACALVGSPIPAARFVDSEAT